jgi:multisubunit Na+/H+ antiporter MnhB subunit
MIRKSISFVLAGLLIVVPVLAFLLMLLGHWKPGSGSIALLIFSFAVGAMWLATEVSEILRGQQQP